jgi:hypothetical protein
MRSWRTGASAIRPAVVDAADGGRVLDPGVGEEHLVEQGPAGHLLQRPHLDARLVHVDGEVGDALVLGRVRVGAGQQHAEVGDLAARRPHLLPVDDPLVAVLHRLGVQAGEVGPGAGLAEQLAPRLLTRDDVAEVALLLLVAAVVDDGRPGQQQAQAARRAEGAEVGDRLLHGHALLARQALAEPLLGPRGDGPPGRPEALPPLADGAIGVPVLLEPLLELGHHVGVAAGGGVGHRCSSGSASHQSSATLTARSS